MIASGSAFSRPQTPAAKCLHVIRLRELTSRSELVQATGLSQPTITRAIAALVDAGFVTERTDLTRARGRGRPTIPLELGEPRAIHAGISVGTMSTYVALFDLKGRTLRSVDIDIPVARLSEDDFIQHVMAGLNRLRAGLNRPLATIGVTTSGTVTGDGEVFAPNLNWRGVNIGAQMREQFAVPVVVTSAAAAIVGRCRGRRRGVASKKKEPLRTSQRSTTVAMSSTYPGIARATNLDVSRNRPAPGT